VDLMLSADAQTNARALPAGATQQLPPNFQARPQTAAAPSPASCASSDSPCFSQKAGPMPRTSISSP